MIYAVIMAGGKGERFWPASRKKHPKQLLEFFGEKTLLELTIERISELVPYKNIIVVTNTDQFQTVKKTISNIPEKNIIAEPIGRNTAPCIGLAARFIESSNPKGVMIVLPADHIIQRQKNFIMNMNDAAKVAQDTDNLITIGIKPLGPETGYGYIKVGERKKFGLKTIFTTVSGFYEKPDEQTAQRFFESGDYLWNSGMFVWRCDSILEAIKRFLPKMYAKLSALNLSFEKSVNSNNLRNIYEQIEAISIDYGVMEKAKNVLVASAEFIWDDVGSWTALERHCKKDAKGNIVSGNVIEIDTKNCIVEGKDRLIATLGLKDLIVIDTDDALLICRKERAQDIKKIVAELKKSDKHKKYL